VFLGYSVLSSVTNCAETTDKASHNAPGFGFAVMKEL